MTREEAIKRLKEARNTMQPFRYVDEAIDYAIQALEKEQKTGHWVQVSYYNFCCSECGEFYNNAYLMKECPNCHAIMNGKDGVNCDQRTGII